LAGITATITNSLADDFFFGQEIVSHVGCGAKTGAVSGVSYFKEYLPKGQVIDFPFDGIDPLIDLEDHRYAIGTIRLNINATLTNTGSYCGGQYADCCSFDIKFDYSGSDVFQFHSEFPRGNPLFGLNPFAEYYRACNHLQEKCEHCGVEWHIKGRGSMKANRCEQHSVPDPNSLPAMH
jgi:hypothetical protein